MPKVSVVVPSFNRGHCIKACVESALDQSFPDTEIVVVDDCSTDDTKDQVLLLADPRIRYIAHESNLGGAAARNTGIRAARGEFVAFLDSDDRWAPEKLEKQMRLLEFRGGSYGICYTWLVVQDQFGEELWRTHKTVDGLAVPELLVENSIGTFSSVMVRRANLEGVGGLDEKMRSCQDWDLYVRLNAITRICCVTEHLVYYQQNRTDKHRISINPRSIVLGRRRMLYKLEDRFSSMSAEAKVASLKSFSKDFVAAGAVADVLRTGLRIVSIAPSITNALLVMRTFAQVIKRNLTRNFGY